MKLKCITKHQNRKKIAQEEKMLLEIKGLLATEKVARKSKSCVTSDRPKPNQCTVQSRSQGLSFENKIERVLKEEPSTT